MNVIIKYGGNAMTDERIKDGVLSSISDLHKAGIKTTLVHGGGPVIKDLLTKAGVETEFEDGHRVTDETAMKYVEMALSANVNGDLVRRLIGFGSPAVGLSGKDGAIAKAVKRYHIKTNADGITEKVDIGFVGNVAEIDRTLLDILHDSSYLPVLSPVSIGRDDGMDYNINADVFAGSIAGALKGDYYVVLTDVDGLMEDINDPESLIPSITAKELAEQSDMIKGGMIPKIESCLHALKAGAKKALILNGTKPDSLKKVFLESESIGTEILP